MYGIGIFQNNQILYNSVEIVRENHNLDSTKRLLSRPAHSKGAEITPPRQHIFTNTSLKQSVDTISIILSSALAEVAEP